MQIVRLWAAWRNDALADAIVGHLQTSGRAFIAELTTAPDVVLLATPEAARAG